MVERSALAVAGDVHHDQPRVPLRKRLRLQAEAAERTGREVADQDIGPLKQPGEHGQVGRFGQVERGGLLPWFSQGKWALMPRTTPS